MDLIKALGTTFPKFRRPRFWWWPYCWMFASTFLWNIVNGKEQVSQPNSAQIAKETFSSTQEEENHMGKLNCPKLMCQILCQVKFHSKQEAWSHGCSSSQSPATLLFDWFLDTLCQNSQDLSFMFILNATIVLDITGGGLCLIYLALNALTMNSVNEIKVSPS